MQILEIVILFVFLIIIALWWSYGRSSVIIGGSDNSELEDAYIGYKQTQQQLHIIRSLPRSYEALNAFERWQISAANSSREVADASFTRELVLKRIVPTPADAKIIIEKLVEDKKYHAPRSSPKIIGNPPTVYYGDFKYTLTPSRYNLLKNYGTDTDITICCLKYWNGRGQQWSIPKRVYEALHSRGASVEGFASPLNSQMLQLGGEYCSLYETDKSLGSRGNFFHYNLRGKTSVINPPFILDLMEKTVEKCLDEISSPDTIMFIITPAWRDAEYYHQLEQSSKLQSRIELGPGEYYYETESGGKIIANFPSTMFVLGGIIGNYDDIAQSFKIKN